MTVPAVAQAQLLQHLQQIVGERSPQRDPERLKAVEQYLADTMTQAGCHVERDPFFCFGQTFHNVIGTIPGTAPGPGFVVGAHFDAVPGTPGADDNASGVAALLEVARLAAGWQPRVTIRCVGFNIEEYAMAGSLHYAERLKRGRERLLGMVSLEMLGFTEHVGLQRYPPRLGRRLPAKGNYVGVVGNRRSKRLLRHMADHLRAVPELPVESLTVPLNGWLQPMTRLSDHSPFWDRGYPALLVTDTAFLRNPHYHASSDTLATLDLPFLTRITQGIVSALYDLTCTVA
ncbi:MAG: M28 family peptidase [Candidatus Omnitrophica bacterium]|nr:M28 family peptidase [Candidatus Omnitrophota bacterium]